MPTLPFALAMDGENYLHPEGPQLDTSLFSVPSSNMEVEQSNLYTPIYLLLYVFLNFFFFSFSVIRVPSLPLLAPGGPSLSRRDTALCNLETSKLFFFFLNKQQWQTFFLIFIPFCHCNFFFYVSYI